MQQAVWTRDVRRFVLEKLQISKNARILEVGCGTGAITNSLKPPGPAKLYGLDIHFTSLLLAKDIDKKTIFMCGDGLALPFLSQTFNLTLCHYYLIWVKDNIQAVKEMARITRSGGYVAAFAEPDYSAREDLPYEMKELGKMQNRALTLQGVDIHTSKKIRGLFQKAGLQDIHVHQIRRNQQAQNTSETDWEMEWQVLHFDLQELAKRKIITEQKIERYHQIDMQSRKEGNRQLYIPTYYGWGRVK
ncbi:MAG TPA: methyltransferase domain-containing protein [Anaerolineae bacterium]|nr:methyltransferase domain-containing protein [Anaerolineae bacterium]